MQAMSKTKRKCLKQQGTECLCLFVCSILRFLFIITKSTNFKPLFCVSCTGKLVDFLKQNQNYIWAYLKVLKCIKSTILTCLQMLLTCISDLCIILLNTDTFWFSIGIFSTKLKFLEICKTNSNLFQKDLRVIKESSAGSHWVLSGCKYIPKQLHYNMAFFSPSNVLWRIWNSFRLSSSSHGKVMY
jgi:hypothetical protein